MRAENFSAPTPGLVDALIFVAATTIGLISAMVWYPATWIGEQQLPMLHDSYYHAVRILEAAETGTPWVVQYDTLAFAPKGDWIPWPWGYDSLMAAALIAAMALLPSQEPITLLLQLTLIWVPLSLALVVILTRLLALPPLLRLTVSCAYAATPVFQLLHGFGALDHHQVEQLGWLAALGAWLWWLDRPGATARATLTGVTIALVQVLHSSLFFIHLASLGLVVLLWLRDRLPGPRAALAFTLGIMLAGIVVALPSRPIWEGQVNHYTYSWLQLLLGAGLGAVLLTLSHLGMTRIRFGLLLALTGLGALIAHDLIIEAFSYLAGQGSALGSITEVQPWIGEMLMGRRDPMEVAAYYSGWVWLWPMATAIAVLGLLSRSPKEIAVASFAVLGLLLCAAQVRFASFGMLFLILLPALALARLTSAHAAPWARRGFAMLALVLLLPGIARISTRPPTTNDPAHRMLMPAYTALAEHCADRPRAVLADRNLGHYIRYHTNCAVMANNFLTNHRQRERALLADRLTTLPPPQLADSDTKAELYLVVLRDHLLRQAASAPDDELLSWLDPEQRDYPGAKLTWESGYLVRINDRPFVFARLFERTSARSE